MKITPLEIRQKTFEKAFRGLDKDEVTAFLITMSQEWEKLIDENKELRIKLEASEKEVEKLREVENSLFKTLKTAEDTGANMIDQATKTADLHMRETQMKADALLTDAKNRAKDIMEEAELKSRNTIDEMESEIRDLVHVYRALENAKDDLLVDIRSFANDALEKVERVRSQKKKFDVEAMVVRLKRESVDKVAKTTLKLDSETTSDFASTNPSIELYNAEKDDEDYGFKDEVEEVNYREEVEPVKEEEPVMEEPKKVSPEEKKEKPKKSKSTSFFDDIE